MQKMQCRIRQAIMPFLQRTYTIVGATCVGTLVKAVVQEGLMHKRRSVVLPTQRQSQAGRQ